ncbi:hypothetical protein N4T77_12395 [Clostridium sp. CX1]|uniref:Uncharacterized protein n=1 Tax=Clostridium tanneri TaxID=3037988 RepID=A0ABU4JR04_9CLOT|nr:MULTISPECIES: hypothetical protein [unclassified Clostridium]MCT8977402.1 hypothetical protein [Clostridium sp. CX1]MDW8800553.1 hypothetical protein [Clostridium sp. A1-XYC3]
MLIFKTESIIFKVDNEELPEDIILMIEIEFRELGTLSEETMKRYNIKIECT